MEVQNLRWAVAWLKSASHGSLIEGVNESSFMGPSLSLCVRVFDFVLYNYHHSVLPESISLEMDIRTSCVTSCLSACPNFSFCHKLALPLRCFLSLERPKWDTCNGTLGRREGKLVGWLETSVPRECARPFDRKKWLTVSVCLAGRHGHPEVGGLGGPGWQKTCQNEDNKQGHANCVTVKL